MENSKQLKQFNILTVHTDGGARGNPGPAGIGIVVDNPMIRETGSSDDQRKQIKIAKYIGLATNNQAEYQAVIEALSWIIANVKEDTTAKFYLDSQLVVEQLNGNYKIKNDGLKLLHGEARGLIMKLGGRVSFLHIPREQNKIADGLVNKAIDEMLEAK